MILGKDEVLDHVLVALLAGHHLLMEDVPGVGKTTLAKALARCFSGDFRRVQFTPDLLPSDILGSSVYNQHDGTFTFKEGPIFAKVLLADEINRASPRTQSALLEAMSEQQVSTDGARGPCSLPSWSSRPRTPSSSTARTRCPRRSSTASALRIELGYPAAEQEVDVLFAQAERHPLDSVAPVLSGDDVIALQAEVRHVRVERSLGRYVVALAEATRRHSSVRLGCSPRGSLMLFRSTQARALLEGRAFAVPEDVKAAGRNGPRPPPGPRDEGPLHRRFQGGRRARDPRGRAGAGLIDRHSGEQMATNPLTPTARQVVSPARPARLLRASADGARAIRAVGNAGRWPSSAWTPDGRSSSCCSRSRRHRSCLA